MKKKKLIMVLIFSILFTSTSFGKTVSTYALLKSDITKTNKRELVKLVNDLVKEGTPSRMVGHPGHSKVREWLNTTIKAFDLKQTGKIVNESFDPDIQEGQRFYQKDFDDKIAGKFSPKSVDYIKWFNFTQYMKAKLIEYKDVKGQNIIWEKTGIDSKKWIVVTAHYDTISHDPQSLLITEKLPMPGANYNGTGVAMALALIKLFSQIDLNYNIQIVFLDWQGLGFLGSYQHAQNLKSSGKEVKGIINLEMLGQDSTFYDKTKKMGNMSLYLRDLDSEVKWAQELHAQGENLTKKVSFELKKNNFESSDNFRFWEKDFLCLTFSQNWEDDFNPKLYQTESDTPEMLNQDTFYEAYTFIAGAVGASLLDITK